MFTLQVDSERAIAHMDQRAARVSAAVGATVTELAAELYGQCVARAPVKTGKLRRSIYQRTTINPNQAIGTVGVETVTTPYAAFMEYGTKPHDIYPKTAKALMFEIGGETIFAKHVRHPGTAPRMYIHGPFEAMTPRIIDRIKAAVAEGLE